MSEGILEKKKVFHQELYRKRFVYFKQNISTRKVWFNERLEKKNSDQTEKKKRNQL